MNLTFHRALSYIVVSLFLGLLSPAFAAVYEEGKQYELLDTDRQLTIDKQPEVIEFFFYGCPNCNDMVPFVKKWLKAKPRHVKFETIPALFSDRWAWSAYLHSTAKTLKVKDKLHFKIFEKQFDLGGLNSKQDLYDIFATAGISKEEFDKASESFTVKQFVQQSEEYTKRVAITGTPAYLVLGKYLVTTTTAGSKEEIFKVVDYLLQTKK